MGVLCLVEQPALHEGLLCTLRLTLREIAKFPRGADPDTHGGLLGVLVLLVKDLYRLSGAIRPLVRDVLLQVRFCNYSVYFFISLKIYSHPSLHRCLERLRRQWYSPEDMSSV